MAGPVVVVGDCIVDEIRQPSGVQRRPGGAGLNLAVGLRLLGVPSTLIAQIGGDEDGRWLHEYLREQRVELRARPGQATGVAVSDRTGGEPRYRFSDAILRRSLSFDAPDHRIVSASAGVVVNTFSYHDTEQVAGLRTLLRAGPGVRAVDPNPRPASLRNPPRYRANFEAIAAESDLVKIGDEDAELLYPGYGLDRTGDLLLGLGATAVLLTRGPAGASVRTRQGQVDEPVGCLEGSVVDTMGAGDATLAVLLAHLVEHGMPDGETGWTAVLRRAMFVAAATCRHHGGLLTLPDRYDSGDGRRRRR